ncbi:hypothetical protein HLPR_02560 [Helicovermis profundi]|uniref:Uncharacterized protein n=1 Tax=Helicovermis profundi TaxID=3065157 RepID=A0AAU9EN99_9FIRM|nr:hypothetical protein HLPR_02560 [Clostridia bacterium S502]
MLDKTSLPFFTRAHEVSSQLLSIDIIITSLFSILITVNPFLIVIFIYPNNNSIISYLAIIKKDID